MKFDQLKNTPFWKKAIKLIKEHLGSEELPKQMKEKIEEINNFSEIGPKQIKQWAGHTLYLVDAILKSKKTSSDSQLFFVRIYSLITEGLEYFININKIYDVSNITSEIEALIKSFTDEELWTIEYYRHTQCHIFQDSYRMNVSFKKGKVITKPLRKGIELEKINKAIDLEIRKYTTRIGNINFPDEFKLVSAYAEKSRYKLESIYNEITKYGGN